jgi:hypothetical protein
MGEPDLTIISLGAGVQSTTLYWLACRGEITPRPDRAIFADTQAEPPEVYRHLEAMKAHPEATIPIDVVTIGSLERDILDPKEGKRFAAIPLRVQSRDGRSNSLLRRQCTREYKLAPIQKRCRELLGLKPRQRAAGRFIVEQWIGISIDEAHRAKPSRVKWITTRHPLLFDVPMRRRDCKRWLERHGYTIPVKSACYFCPYHDDATWERMKAEQPDIWAKAVLFDKAVRHGLRGVQEDAYLHRSLVPLDEVDFDPSQNMSLFGEECEGMCGV